MQLHPIMYVDDQYAERDFYRQFGFQDHFEGDEFPGFLAIRHGEAVIGLQAASEGHPAYARGLRWQFEVETVDEIHAIIATCERLDLRHHVEIEKGGEHFLTHLVCAVSPGGVEVWFEGPNEVGA